VTFGAPLKRPPEVRRSDAIRIELENEIYVQNVDIYVDQDPSPRNGVTEAVPGRNVVFAPEAAWEKVVILAPMPFAVRSALSGWAVKVGRSYRRICKAAATPSPPGCRSISLGARPNLTGATRC
jgi:hypothetical protein